MRDAFGGVFMMRLLLVFIVVLVAFTAISFKYAKSFRVKNKVIDFVEQNQIIDLDTFFNTGNNSQKLQSILSATEYDLACRNGNGPLQNEEGIIDRYCFNGVIIKKNYNKSNNHTTTYDIYTYVDWNLGVLNTLLMLGGKSKDSEEVIGGTWQISGEAIVKY